MLPFFCASIAPLLARESGGKLEVAEAGTSSGIETWSLLAMFALSGVRVHMDAYERDSHALTAAKRGHYVYPLWAPESAGYPERLFDQFQPVPSRPMYIEPLPTLRRQVDFYRQDLLEKPMAHRKSDVAFALAILSNYGGDRQERLFQSIVQGVREGGVLVTEKDTRLSRWLTEPHPGVRLEPFAGIGQAHAGQLHRVRHT